VESSQPVARRQPPPKDLADVFVFLAIALVGGWLLVVWAIVKRPVLSMPVAAYVGLVVCLGAQGAQDLVLWLVVARSWRCAWCTSGPISGLLAAGCGRHFGGCGCTSRGGVARWCTPVWGSYRLREAVPKISRVKSTPWGDRVLVRLVVRQCTEDLEAVAPELARSFGARACRVREGRPGRLWLEFATGDPLTAVVPALPVPEVVDLEAVPIGMREDGEPWRLRVRGTHLLIAGATGSGKGSVLWSLLRGLAPEIRSGRVAVWAIDPKGGMELGPGRALFTRFCGEASRRWRSCSTTPSR
jgi:S-DNA-T family DNA segregation ATPase FtsK/SpoIIIE